MVAQSKVLKAELVEEDDSWHPRAALSRQDTAGSVFRTMRRRAAGPVLRAVKLADVGAPGGPTTPEAVRQDRALTALIGAL